MAEKVKKQITDVEQMRHYMIRPNRYEVEDIRKKRRISNKV